MVHGKTTFEWHTNDIRVHKSDIRTTCECIWVICEWHTRTKHLYLLFILHVILYVTRLSFVFNCMSFFCHPSIICVSLVCQSYVLVCHSYIPMYSYVIRMSLVYIRKSLVCHSYVLVCFSYVTRMNSDVIRICHSYVLVCHSYALVCHWYVTRMYSYVSRMCFYHEPLNMILVDYEKFSNHKFIIRLHTIFVSVWWIPKTQLYY